MSQPAVGDERYGSFDPRHFVTEVAIADLIEAWSEPFGPLSMRVLDGEIAFPCPVCGADPQRPDPPNIGGAVVLDSWRWRCSVCRFVGTRAVLERLVLEDADRFTALYELVDDRRMPA